MCYEFKGKVDEREFLVYINAENGKEEDVLVITNTPNGTLTEWFICSKQTNKRN